MYRAKYSPLVTYLQIFVIFVAIFSKNYDSLIENNCIFSTRLPLRGTSGQVEN
jgi:hypothetical protein